MGRVRETAEAMWNGEGVLGEEPWRMFASTFDEPPNRGFEP